MIPTVPIDLVLNVTVGSSIALASRGTFGSQTLWRTPALWTLVVFELLVFVPVGAYSLWRFPEWSLMYLFDAGELPIPDYSLAALFPAAAVGGFLATRLLLIRKKLWPAAGLLVGSLAVTAAIAYLGRESLLHVGSTQAFRSAPETMRGIVGTQLGYLVAGAVVAVAIGWGTTLWRLVLVSRAMRPHLAKEAPTIVREDPGDPEPSQKSSKAKKGRKRKAS